MQQYEEFLEHINKYFEYDEVVTQGNIISAYDLINIIKNNMTILHDIIFEKKEDIKQLESFYQGTSLLEKVYHKLVKFKTPRIEFINQSYEGNNARIHIRFYPITIKKIHYFSLEICKDNNNDEIYLKDFNDLDQDREFVNYFHDVFLHTLQTLEYFFEVFKLSLPDIREIPDSHSDIKETIDDNFLRLEIKYGGYGHMQYNLSIVPSADPDNIYTRVWLEKPPLSSYVTDHKEELLKRIPINILDLKETTQKIITDHYARNNVDEQKLELK